MYLFCWLGPTELTHIVVDPSILSSADYRYEKFKEGRIDP